MSSVTTTEYCEPCMFVKLESVKADTFCEDCRERYCECCALDHAKFRVFRNHHIVDVRLATDYEIPPVRGPKTVTDEENNTLNDSRNLDLSSNTGRAAIRTVDGEDRTTKGKFGGTDRDKDAASFNVKVDNTELAKRIPGVRVTDLPETLFKFTVGRSEISLSLVHKVVFQAGYHTVRRFGCKADRVNIEFGRACVLGQGLLTVISAEASTILSVIQEQTRS